MTPPGFITFTTPEGSVTVLAGDGVVTVTGGYGGWETVSRPRNVGLTVWMGYEPLKMSVPILFDSLASGDGNATEQSIAALERMAGRGSGKGGDTPPPVVKLSAYGALVPHKNIDWHIESIEWGEAVRNSSGNRVRQEATVGVIQSVVDKTLKSKSAANRRRSSSKGPKRYRVKKGDKISRIAKKHLGDADRWREIKASNGKPIRDPRNLKPGTLIRLP